MNYYGMELEDPTLIKKAIVDLIQVHMDNQARALGYDDLKTAITYRGDPNEKFAAEAEAFFLWRSAVWTTSYQVLAEVEAGTRELPTMEEVMTLLPILQLPSSDPVEA